ncbi:hypothetical protein M501DRAFT_1059904 [Patellaria atrata CBS 101060]|uniref:Dynactin subunit n=1 Tax=Patellaria atrata CBS 101060 TaxID=1346257 RepID=A0A9P4VKL6_9PEZI|nr:hypothetical protein M501DRAFT_1059904 [Patellaria atrata CBS 101060]
MSQIRKYAALPDLDSAPDIYETTPSLTDDNSTLRTSTRARSNSDFSYEDAEESQDTGIDRRHTRPDVARNCFLPARVDAKNVDFSDALSRSYRTGTRRRRKGEAQSDEELGDMSDEEESLERKLARLRREVEEVKLEFYKRKEEGGKSKNEEDEETEDEDDPLASITKISKSLDEVYVQRRGGTQGANAHLASLLKKFVKSSEQAARESTKGIQSTEPSQSPQISQQQQAQVLTRAAELDSRLAAIEASLGLDGKTMPDVAEDPPKPILHTLQTIDQQLSTISAASSNTLDAASKRIRSLIQEAEKLRSLRQSNQETSQANADRGARRFSTANGDAGESAALQDPEKTSRINALYGTLSTIDSLSQSLPLVLERLRTLRLIHASAGTASSTLDEIEKRQEEQRAEIEQWRGALEKVEAKLGEGERVTVSNVKVVGDWVKDLERRLDGLR